jgi:hypothetical protein
MRAIVVVVVHELREQSEQMPLVDDDNVVKTLLAKGVGHTYPWVGWLLRVAVANP